MATYPDEKFQEIYDSILASMGDDDTLKANLEAALKPMYDQSVQQLQQQRIANNAAIDVDAASRGMWNSTWVTDAKLRQLRGESDQLASLNANYNNQLYSALLNAIQDRDDKAYNQALTWFQYNQANKGGGGTPSAQITPNTMTYDQWMTFMQSLDNDPYKVPTPPVGNQSAPDKNNNYMSSLAGVFNTNKKQPQKYVNGPTSLYDFN